MSYERNKNNFEGRYELWKHSQIFHKKRRLRRADIFHINRIRKVQEKSMQMESKCEKIFSSLRSERVVPESTVLHFYW